MENKSDFKTGKVGLVAFSHFLHDVYPAFFAPMLPLLIEKLGITYAMGGFLVLLIRFPSILNPIFGALADKYNLKITIALMPALTAAAMVCVPLAPSYILVCALMLFAGFSSALYHVPAPVVIRRLSGVRIGAGMSYFMFAGELARTAGPMIVITAISLVGFENVWITAFAGFALSAALLFKLKDLPDIKSNGHVKPWVGVAKTWQRNKKLFATIAGLVLCKSFIVLALTSFLPAFMTTKGFGLWLAGSALSILELSGAAGSMTSGTLSDKIGRKRMLTFITAAAPVVLLGFLFSAGWMQYALLFVLGFLSFSESPVFMALVQDHEHEFPASANSIYMTLNFVIGSIAALMIGYMGDWFGLDKAFFVCAGIAFIGIVLVQFLPPDKKS